MNDHVKEEALLQEELIIEDNDDVVDIKEEPAETFPTVVHHYVTPDQDKCHKCHKCKKLFKTRADLLLHFQILHVNEQKPFQCDDCMMRFATMSLLKKHWPVHREGKPYQCDQCSCAYKRKSTLDNHKAMNHGEEGKYTCEICGKKFMVFSKFEKHLPRHSEGNELQCDKCGYYYKTKITLEKHRSEVHFVERPFKCELCSKEFSYKSSLQRHMPTHVHDARRRAESLKNGAGTSSQAVFRREEKPKVDSDECDMADEVKVEPEEMYDPEEKVQVSAWAWT